MYRERTVTLFSVQKWWKEDEMQNMSNKRAEFWGFSACRRRYVLENRLCADSWYLKIKDTITMNTKNWRSCWQHGFTSTLKTSSGRGPATERTRSLAENAAFLSQSRASLSSQSSSLLLSTAFVAPTSTSNPRQLWFFGIHYPLWFCFKKFRLLEEQLFARTLSPPLLLLPSVQRRRSVM